MTGLDVAALYVEHAATVRAWLLRHLPGYDPETADDLTAEVFVKAVRAADRYQEHGTPGAWLHQIAQRTLIDHVRGLRGKRVRLDILDYHRATADAGSDRHLNAITVHAALEQVPERFRVVLTERFLLGRDPSETSDHMGRSYRAVVKLQWRAVRAMRELCKDGAA